MLCKHQNWSHYLGQTKCSGQFFRCCPSLPLLWKVIDIDMQGNYWHGLTCTILYISLHLSLWQRVLSHQDDTALLKAYIVEWRKFFTQCDILPKPFCQLEITLMGKQGSNKKTNMEDSIVRKVRGGSAD